MLMKRPWLLARKCGVKALVTANTPNTLVAYCYWICSMLVVSVGPIRQ